jgi:hypothetical protein
MAGPYTRRIHNLRRHQSLTKYRNMRSDKSSKKRINVRKGKKKQSRYTPWGRGDIAPTHS